MYPCRGNQRSCRLTSGRMTMRPILPAGCLLLLLCNGGNAQEPDWFKECFPSRYPRVMTLCSDQLRARKLYEDLAKRYPTQPVTLRPTHPPLMEVHTASRNTYCYQQVAYEPGRNNEVIYSCYWYLPESSLPPRQPGPIAGFAPAPSDYRDR